MGIGTSPKAALGAISVNRPLSYRSHRSARAAGSEDALHCADGSIRELRSCLRARSPLPDLNPDLIGRDVRQLLKDRLCQHNIDRTAFVDLVMGTSRDQQTNI
jgi:hypothetical protein